MKALITGITGQDGSYLSELLLNKGYEVFGLIRGQANPKRATVDSRVELLDGDLTDFASLNRALRDCDPDEVYNLGAISFVGLSWKQPLLTSDVTGMGCLRLLEAVRCHNDQIRLFQPSSSEMFGQVRETPQTESTPFHPRSPYGTAKTFAHYSTINYRESYGMHASTAILFNHESPRRGHEFVTRKITSSVARISLGLQDRIELGNIAARRDWGFAGDYMQAAWMILQQPSPDDFVVATGDTYSIRDLLDIAFRTIGVDNWESYVTSDASLYRPAEVDVLTGDASKARTQLGWAPTMSFHRLITSMVANDLRLERAAA